ncbi:formyltetrahydrofolate deformylase [Halomarina oriensis]|uniref:Formyltetrahydrofolate deformylase n=1 Tax=Halomarina oriensis TaxID=671145 RepID=A0A6B0GH80_9EURY|nr:formyltetrahydrofolate deformylase [Halomarina oriensis]MWG34084.1 formyltetrahydrofolate deformylase [Halomarina oriensis]
MTRQLAQVTVVGDDKKGIIARVTTLLFERGVNVEDLDQAVQDGVFRMTLHVDTTDMVVKEETLREALSELGDELGQDISVRFPGDRDTDRIAVLVTKESHCLEALVEAREAGTLDAELSVVVGNHDHLAPVAEDAGIPFYDIGDGSGSPDEAWLLDILDEHDVDLVVLARYMRILSPNVVFRYEDRIINVHPSLLPAFPGAEAYRQAREDGVRIAGVTAHYVTTDLDQGPVIAQRAFDVPDGASVADLEARGQPLEAEALVEAVRLHLDDALTVYHGRTHLREESDDEAYQLGLSDEAQSANPTEPVDEGVPDASEADD